MGHRTVFWSARALALGIGLAFASPAFAQKPPAPPPPAKAQEQVKAEVIVLLGTNDGTGIEKSLGEIRELLKPPFSAYNSYKFLEKKQVDLPKSDSRSVKLPNGRELKMLFKDVLTSVDPATKVETRKFVVSAQIQKPDGKSFLPLLEVNSKLGDTVWVAGQSYKGGVLVIGLRLVP